ncbi:hypothetical protein K469DRAFT_48707 [Zopfia rhizophila CBS 207.26]|uniref:Uncharacterized protein n=1 Tax=Zopfia rhizophila CBS 207.26 TaxID=1314779 RepID=A0A6A6EI77_9PEZI|nr:hypothetical protein K469DRAFT_48707 [Zopfia rhizophila CBS 207.26]
MFLYGMPEDFLDIALLWEPRPGIIGLKPTQHVQDLTPILQVPTRLWAAWAGSFVTQSWGRYDITGSYHWIPSVSRQVIPTVRWFTMSSPSASFRRRANPNGSNTNPTLNTSPNHYQRDSNATTRIARGTGTGRIRNTFTHTSTPIKKWKWPFPIVAKGKSPIIPELMPYIFCRTSRAYLLTGDLSPDIPDTPNPLGPIYEEIITYLLNKRGFMLVYSLCKIIMTLT